MSNPLINLLGASSKGVSSGNKSIVQQFIEFKNSFKGDPHKSNAVSVNNFITSLHTPLLGLLTETALLLCVILLF